MRYPVHIFICVACTCSGLVGADSIEINGRLFDGVTVVEGARRVYVTDHSTNSVRSYARDVVDIGPIEYSDAVPVPDSQRVEIPTTNPLSDEFVAPAIPHIQRNRERTEREKVPPRRMRGSQAWISNVNLQNIPLHIALDALLRPLNLGYEVRDNIIYVSSPDRLNMRAARELETRIYAITAADQTMPKIVVTSGGGSSVGSATGGRGGASSGGSVASGGSGFSGGAGARAGNDFAGGGGAAGRGGGGATGGGQGGGSAHFPNISQLFSTIDDASVGEPPAVICAP